MKLTAIAVELKSTTCFFLLLKKSVMFACSVSHVLRVQLKVLDGCRLKIEMETVEMERVQKEYFEARKKQKRIFVVDQSTPPGSLVLKLEVMT